MRITVALLFVFAVICPHAARSAPTAESNQSVVVISVDGLAAFYMDDPQAEMPTIRSLAQAGAAASMMKVSAPSVTWPNHTTLVTGVTPARHGVVGNDYFDRARKKTVVLMTDPEAAKDHLVRVPTIYDLAKSRGLTTAAIRWPSTGNAKTLDWTLPDVFSVELLHKYTTPALLAECQQAGIWSDGDAVQYGKRELRIVSDDACARIFNFILRTHHPNLALLHLTDVDNVEHRNGPRTPEAYAAIKSADDHVRQVWEEVKRDYAGNATVMIVSDHGFSPVERLVLPNVVLREAGLIEVNDGKATGGSVHVVVQGGAALVYVLDEAKHALVVERVKQAFDGSEGIAKVVGPGQLKDHGIAEPQDDPRSPDMILFAKLGYTFADTATGPATIIEKPAGKGAHGHDENLPDLHATFIAWGPGIKPGARLGVIQNTDVAPTIARLLGLPLSGMDGKVLSAALAD